MGISGHKHIFILLCLLHKRIKQRLYALMQVDKRATREELQIDHHLIVTRTARVDSLACIATHLGEQELHLRVNVLNTLLDSEIASQNLLIYLLQTLGQRIAILIGDQPDRVEHLHMSHITQHVGLGQVEVQLAVATYGKLLDKRIGRVSFIPKFHCISFIQFSTYQVQPHTSPPPRQSPRGGYIHRPYVSGRYRPAPTST